MQEIDLQAIQDRYNPQNSKFRDVGRCTLNDISALLSHIEQQQREIERLQGKQRWISFMGKETLPRERSRHYLVMTKMNWAHGGTWENNDGDAQRNMAIAYFDCTGKFNVPHVTHWRPLPKAPEGVEVTNHENNR